MGSSTVGIGSTWGSQVPAPGKSSDPLAGALCPLGPLLWAHALVTPADGLDCESLLGSLPELSLGSSNLPLLSDTFPFGACSF